MKNFIVTLVVAVLVLVSGYFYFFSAPDNSPVPAPVSRNSSGFTPEIEKALSLEKMFIQKLANERVIIEETLASNERNKNVTESERNALDKQWINSKSITPFIRSFLENKTAVFLLEFQKLHPEYREIFVADSYGLNVGQTDKTSDYYQADESWWVDSYGGGIGQLTNGKIEFDDSSQVESISIYAPVTNPDTSKAIGVLKAVLDIVALSEKL